MSMRWMVRLRTRHISVRCAHIQFAQRMCGGGVLTTGEEGNEQKERITYRNIKAAFS